MNYKEAFEKCFTKLKTVNGPQKGAWRAACGPRVGHCPSLS